jgi:hypothetical protein
MVNPRTILKDGWRKVESGIQSAGIYRVKTTTNYLMTTVPADAAAPASIDVGFPIFRAEEPDYEFRSWTAPVDLYFYCRGEDGEILVETGVSDGGTSQPTEGSPSPAIEIESEAPGVEHFLWEELNTVSPLGAGILPRGTNTVTFDPGHGFLNPSGLDEDFWNVHYVDETIGGFVGIRFLQLVITSVVGDVVEFTPPLPFDLDPAKIEKSMRVNTNMAVTATRAAPVVFQTYPPDGQAWELRRFMPSMVLSSAGDDGLFGNLARLVNGEYSGFENALFAEYQVVIKDNGDWASSAYDTKYPLRSGGGGSHGFNVRKTESGKDKKNRVIVLYGITDDRFVNVKQDSSVGIIRYRIKVQGGVRA